MMQTLEQSFKETLWNLYEELKRDADHWWIELNAEFEDEILRRSAVRSTFACIEGIIFGLKQLLLVVRRGNVYAFTPAEEALLREELYELDEKGRPLERKAKLRITGNLLFAFNMMAK